MKEAAENGEPLEHAIRAYQEGMVIYAFREVREATDMLNRGNMKNPIARWFMFGLLPGMHPFRNQS